MDSIPYKANWFCAVNVLQVDAKNINHHFISGAMISKGTTHTMSFVPEGKGEPMSDKLKPCPFCGSEVIYETYSQEYAFGTKNPEIFCNSCKVIFSIEDDSPYINSEEDYAYRRVKTAEAWNRRTNDE